MSEYPLEHTDGRPDIIRCVNLDWLEVFCREPDFMPHDMSYFRHAGYVCHDRGYGTRVYKEMFSLEGADGELWFEVRRNPASQGLGGIHTGNECHIRLTNRTCYFDNAASILEDFLSRHGYYDIRLARVDICLDFSRFDFGDNPQAFITRYLRHRYAKINQGNISSHGADNWLGQEWHSLSWGSKSSPVTTKMYNKTLELYEPKTDRFKKPYIRKAWKICGLIDDVQRCTKDGELQDIWRVEFSLRSSKVNWLPIELDGKKKNFQSLKNTLQTYNSREKLLVMFASLARHYFHFKKFKQDTRKDRCPDKELFNFASHQIVYKLQKPDNPGGNGETFVSRYNRLIKHLQEFQLTHPGASIHKAVETICNVITNENQRADLTHYWDNDELELLRKLVHVRTANKELTYEAAMSEVKRLLNITDRTIDTF